MHGVAWMGAEGAVFSSCLGLFYYQVVKSVWNTGAEEKTAWHGFFTVLFLWKTNSTLLLAFFNHHRRRHHHESAVFLLFLVLTQFSSRVEEEKEDNMKRSYLDPSVRREENFSDLVNLIFCVCVLLLLIGDFSWGLHFEVTTSNNHNIFARARDKSRVCTFN